MSLAEFRAAFPGEGQHVEFKRGTSMEQLQNTAVAFSNADGGVILIGVQDDGAIAARALDAGTQDDIHRAMQAARDVGRYGLSELDVDGKPVTVLSVARRREGFAQTSAGVVRVRRGTRDDPCSVPSSCASRTSGRARDTRPQRSRSRSSSVTCCRRSARRSGVRCA
jgi:ATP-dependent DNA helicase RecG